MEMSENAGDAETQRGAGRDEDRARSESAVRERSSEEQANKER